MTIPEIQDELLRLEYPFLLPDHDPDIERYYFLRAAGQSRDALILYRTRLLDRYPDDDFRTWLMRSYRSRDPVYKILLARAYRTLGFRCLARTKRIILYIAEKAESYDARDVYSTLRAVEDIMRVLPRERYEAVADMERYHRYAQALKLRERSIGRAAGLVRSYLIESLPVVAEERRRREDRRFRAMERERKRLIREDWDSYKRQQDPGLREAGLDLSGVVFSGEDLRRIEIPKNLVKLEDQVLAYCVKYWNAAENTAFERILFLYSRKYETKHYDIFMQIRRGRRNNKRDDEILSSIMALLVTGYYYSIQGDKDLQRRWAALKAALASRESPQAAPRSPRAAPASKLAVPGTVSGAKPAVSASASVRDPGAKSAAASGSVSAPDPRAKPTAAPSGRTGEATPKASVPRSADATSQRAVSPPSRELPRPLRAASAPKIAVPGTVSGAKPAAAGTAPARDFGAKSAALGARVVPSARTAEAAPQASVPRPADAAPQASVPRSSRDVSPPSRESPRALRSASASKPAAPTASAPVPVLGLLAKSAAASAPASAPDLRAKPTAAPSARPPEAAPKASVLRSADAAPQAPVPRSPREASPPSREPSRPPRPASAPRPSREVSPPSREPPRPPRPASASAPAPTPAPRAKPAPATRAVPRLSRTAEADPRVKSGGSVADRLRVLSGRSYDVFRERFLAKARGAVRKVLSAGRGRFFTPPPQAEDLIYNFLKTHYADPYMNWAESEERAVLAGIGFELESLIPVIDECYSRL